MNANEHDRRLEEVAAYAIGALDPGQIEELEGHLTDCKRCQEELRWLSPAVRALPEAVERQASPPQLKQRLRAESRAGVGEWLRGLNLGGLTWKPLAGLALVVLVIAGGIGYGVGTDGTASGSHTTEVEPGANGIAAKVVTEGDRGEVHLANVKPLPKGRVLEAWVERDGVVEAVPALFAPDQAGRASTTIEDMKNVSVVMVTREPEGGSKQPSTAPIVEVPINS
jgi:anti-sigma factor RsiW